MKILHTKISNSTSYLLLVFTIASVSLLFYGQFSNLEFETLNNVSPEVEPISNTVSSNSGSVESEVLPAENLEVTDPLDSDVIKNVMMSPEMSEPVVE
ncbi:MAG: hypothetical protein RJB24_185 [Candidatus Parcubacteria bacterium]|jgi:hypothetical protein